MIMVGRTCMGGIVEVYSCMRLIAECKLNLSLNNGPIVLNHSLKCIGGVSNHAVVN